MNIAAIRAAEEDARRAPTDRQMEVLTWIRAFIAKHGYPPTLREIGGGLQIAYPKNVGDHLAALERIGPLLNRLGDS